MPMPDRYLVELAPPPGGWEDLQRLTARARDEAETLSRHGSPVRFLRSIYLPEDDTCLFLYEGDSLEVVGEAGRRAELHVLGIAPALQAQNGSAKGGE
jgi:hypothetical protein